MAEITKYIDVINKQRKEKDLFFKNHSQSPLPERLKQAFTGLSYFPVNPDLHFILPLQIHDDKKTISVGDSKGGVQQYLRWGKFRFSLNGDTFTFHAYKNNPGDPNLWVPFRDETNNEETYGAGRYIDLTHGRDTYDEKWVLDFNLAYNPFCAYSENYVCPFIPPENWLKTPIKAGEKAYKLPK